MVRHLWGLYQTAGWWGRSPTREKW